MGVLLLDLPLAASIVSYGIGFLLIVLLESWILAQRENLRFWHSIRLLTGANLVSTLAGVGVVIALAGLPMAFSFRGNESLVVWLILLSLCLGLGVCTAESLKYLTQLWSGHFLLWGIVWAVIILAELLLIGVVNSSNNQVLQLLATAIYLMVGFVLSVVVEGFWLSRYLPYKSNTLGQTLLIANLRSYAYIAIPITIFLLLRLFPH
jgi:hypothetical protein